MFGDNLKRLREEAGYTQASFAERTGLPLRTIQNWEQGWREPSLAAVVELARLLDVSTDALLAGHTKKASPVREPARGRPRKETPAAPRARRARKK